MVMLKIDFFFFSPKQNTQVVPAQSVYWCGCIQPISTFHIVKVTMVVGDWASDASSGSDAMARCSCFLYECGGDVLKITNKRFVIRLWDQFRLCVEFTGSSFSHRSTPRPPWSWDGDNSCIPTDPWSGMSFQAMDGHSVNEWVISNQVCCRNILTPTERVRPTKTRW